MPTTALTTRVPGLDEDIELTLERPPIEVSTRGHHELDPSWSYTDPSGHVHEGNLDTLNLVVTSTYWCEDCRDEHEESEYRCRECAAVVEPRFLWVDESAIRKFIPGLLEGTLRVQRKGYYETYHLHPDELKALPAVAPDAAWVAQVCSREPDFVGV